VHVTTRIRMAFGGEMTMTKKKKMMIMMIGGWMEG
jgi:hypothetical protein